MSDRIEILKNSPESVTPIEYSTQSLGWLTPNSFLKPVQLC